jgi:predicted AlkP superfamily pyrophosphatase or phosphodiesterase
MEPVNPSVTWPNHTSMVTGVTPAKHGVLYNGLPVRPGPGQPLRVEPWVDKTQLVQAETVYDAAHAAGLTTAEVDWVAIQNAATITWAFPERPQATQTIPKEMIAAGLVTEADIAGFVKSNIVWRDEIWTQAGEYILEKHKPNLLLFHLLTTDSSQHRYGARSLGGNAALTLADTKVERLLAAARRAGIAANTTVLIVSDHGFKTYSQVIHPNAVLRQRGLIRDAGSAVECDAWTIPEGGTANVYVTRPEKKAELVPALRTAFEQVPGVKLVIGSDGFERLGYPQPAATERMCDLVLAAADGYAFDGAHRGDPVTKVPDGASPGAHGYLSTETDMDSAFLAWGAGIKRGSKLGRIRCVDVAATVARLLGVGMKDVQGRVLTEILN